MLQTHTPNGLVIKSSNFGNIADKILDYCESPDEINVAAGITTAYRIGDNQLREFFIVKKVQETLLKRGFNANAILLNDTLDALSHTHLRLLKSFDNTIKLSQYAGHPVCSVPCPYSCHESLSEHFCDDLCSRMETLDMHFNRLKSGDWSSKKEYLSAFETVLEKYDNIEHHIKSSYNIKCPNGLFMCRCTGCGRIDATKIIRTENSATYKCSKCGHEGNVDFSDGKFIWKIECAMRWAANAVHFEPFMNNYLSEPSGSYIVSSDIASRFLGMKPPVTLKFTPIKHRKCFGDIRNIPKWMHETLYLSNLKSDCINKADIFRLAKQKKYESGVSFLDASRIAFAFRNFRTRLITKMNYHIFMIPDKYAETEFEQALLFSKIFDDACTLSMELPDDMRNGELVSAIKVIDYAIESRDVKNFIYRTFSNRSDTCKTLYRLFLGRESGFSIDTLFKLLDKDYLIMMREKLAERIAHEN